VFRRSFYRPSRLLELPFSPLYLVASACVVGASIWLLLFAYQDVPYSHQLWWQFTLDADAPRGLRAAGQRRAAGAVALTWLLRTARPVIHLPTEDELQRANRILLASDQPDGGLALTGDKALLFHPTTRRSSCTPAAAAAWWRCTTRSARPRSAPR
jgi:phosphatidylglycerol lysyltransferase